MTNHIKAGDYVTINNLEIKFYFIIVYITIKTQPQTKKKIFANHIYLVKPL